MNTEKPDAKPPREKRKPSITTVISIGFGALIMVAVGLVLFLGYLSGLRNARELTVEKAVLIVGAVSAQLAQHLDSAQQQTEYLAHLVALGSLDLDNEGRLLALMTASSAAVPQVEVVVYIGLDGRKLSVAPRLARPETLVERWHEGDALESMIRALGKERETAWGAPIFHPESGQVFLNVRTPVYSQEGPVGLFVAAISVDALSYYVRGMGERQGGVAFVLGGESRIIAHPEVAKGIEYRTSEEPLPKASEIGDLVLQRAWTPGEFEETQGDDETMEGGFKLRFTEVDDSGYAIVFRHLYGFDEVAWVVGSYFRVDDFAAAFDRLRNAVIAGFGVLILAIAAAILMGRQINQPVLRLAAAARHLRKRGLEGARVVPSSRLRETAEAARAFNAMVAGLRERDLIRSTFGRFVPQKIVDELLSKEGDLPTETRTATIFFSDIEGFSTISEKLSPEQLVSMLNEYFTVITAPIERRGGVVIQYQGDGVIASFNVPVHDAEHAKNAVNAALEVQALLRNSHFGQEQHRLNTRIGINTGVVVAGPVGSSGRQTYSIHGDEVNVAARIEELNKRYGTRILLAESTVELCEADFAFEPIGEVPIRGRTGAVRLFSVPIATEANAEETPGS